MKDKAIDVLIVEDNEYDTELTEFAIKQLSDKIHFVHFVNGADALNFIRRVGENKIQFILLDISLPKISGLEMLKKIRENETTKELPVVILTSSINESDMHAAYYLGANSYVMKPGGYADYVKKIESLAYYWCYVNDLPNN